MAVVNALSWPLRLLAVGLVTAGLSVGVYFLAQAGGADDQPVFVAGTATAGGDPPTYTPGVATGTLPAPSATPPAASTQPPPISPSPTRDFSLPADFPPVDCGGPRYHLSIEKLQAHPNLAAAVITEVDLDTIRIEIQGAEFLITGWAGDFTIGWAGPEPGQELLEQVAVAVESVLFEC